MSPRLPLASRLLPYFERIDASRIYTNFGPLVEEFERRLETLLGVSAGTLISASSGTAALVGAVLASAGRAAIHRPFALVPAYTFVATAVAAEQCGFQPYLVDVDPDNWTLNPVALLQHPELDRIGVVIPVATYGMAVHQAGWLEFRDRTGIPVVIDGAAELEAATTDSAACLGEIPVVMSFHATKGFACGEGGAVVCSDPDVIFKSMAALNFGFHSSRNSRFPSTNGKMSEYHAAVGLAELDGWTAKCRDFGQVSTHYNAQAATCGLGSRLLTAPKVCSSYVLLHCFSNEESTNVQLRLEYENIEFRFWYGGGLHHHAYFSNAPRGPLDATDRLASRIIGLPMAPDLDPTVIGRIAWSVGEAILDRADQRRRGGG